MEPDTALRDASDEALGHRALGEAKEYLGQFAERFLVRFQQSIGHREHLPCDTTNDASTTNIGSPLLIVAAFDRYQTLVQPGPFAIHSNRLQDRHIDRGFEQARSAWRETSLVQHRSRLSDGRNPPAIQLELSGPFKVGNVANASDEDSSLKRSNPRNRGQNLALPLSSLAYFSSPTP